MQIEIKSHSWIGRDGAKYHADFFPFIDGKPDYSIDCEQCVHSNQNNPDTDCDKAKEIVSDEKIYPFCGPICGYFKMRGE